MKIAIGIKDKESKEINEMFARSSYFLFIEVENKEIVNEKIEENTFTDQMSGAGIAVIEHLAKKEVETIICANLGPRALDLCKQLQIKAYKTNDSTYEKTIELFLKNDLVEIK
ncbi:MAG: NifB/NifX family molybdenum-iron cluster-binding protein [Patescibacteria group bacterium]